MTPSESWSQIHLAVLADLDLLGIGFYAGSVQSVSEIETHRLFEIPIICGKVAFPLGFRGNRRSAGSRPPIFVNR